MAARARGQQPAAARRDPLDVPDDARWSHNLHYARQLIELVPSGARDALDAGCGEGTVARLLRRRVPHVVALDIDAACLDAARAADAGNDIDSVRADMLAAPFTDESFDVVVSVAALHHTDERAALARLARVLRPGGLLAVVGLARSRTRYTPLDVAGAVGTRMHQRTKGLWDPPACMPIVWPPPRTYGDVKAIARRTLPDVEYRRRLLWRYTLVWRKPA